MLVRQDAEKLILTDEYGAEHIVANGDLVRLTPLGDPPRFGHRSQDGWRLVLSEPVDEAILPYLPRRTGSLHRVASPRVMALLVTAAASLCIAAGGIIFAPQEIARKMPMTWERKLGSAFDLPLEAVQCADPKAQAALNRIADRLDPQARRDGITIELVDLDIVNAAALPGARIVVLNGLFEQVEHPDAIAGIVAHEIAHIRRRHVAAAMVRELGLGTVVTLLGGGAVASNAGGLLSLKFSRTAEAEADVDAIAMLDRAAVDPRPTAAAFERFRSEEGDWPDWLGDHPASRGRARQFAASYEPQARYRPALNGPDMKSLLAACRE